MLLEKQSLKREIIKDVITGKLRCDQAARQLEVTPRTVQNYRRRFLERGPDGLDDRRRGNHRKITAREEASIIAFKLERPKRSARLIRDRLGLNVSEETVRLILAKHHLNGKTPRLNPTHLGVQSEILEF
jgi:transposase